MMTPSSRWNVGPVTFYTWNAVGIGTLPDDFDVRRTAATRHSVQRTNHGRRTDWHVIVATTALRPKHTHFAAVGHVVATLRSRA
jgi:hypothetical protein